MGLTPLTVASLPVGPLANLCVPIWPALAVGYRFSAVGTRMVRSTLAEVLQEDCIRTALLPVVMVFATDDFGRDVFSRLMFGARTALSVRQMSYVSPNPPLPGG